MRCVTKRMMLGGLNAVLLIGAAGSTVPPAGGQPISIQKEGPTAGFWTSQVSRPSIVPDEIVVKYRDTVTLPVERILERRLSFRSATADRDDGLDRLGARLGVRSARPIFRPVLRDRTGGRGADQAAVRLEQSERLETARRRFPERTARPVSADVPDLSHVYVLTLAPGTDVQRAAAEYAADPHVAYAHPNYRATAQFVPDDPYYQTSGSWGQPYEDLWGHRKLRMEQAWNTTQGSGVVVAVVDTGLDTAHPDIAANVWSNPLESANGVDDDGNGYVDDLTGWDFAYGDGDVTDRFGHGTHVAGTIAGEAGNGVGIVGIAPRAQVMAIKGLDDNGSGPFDGLAAALVYAAANGADVINNSWGCAGPCPSVPVIEDALRAAHALGTVVVFAAGNAQMDVYNISPQNAPEAIVVSASTSSDGIAFFSNLGAGLDVAAPGAGDNTPPPTEQPYRGILSLKSALCNPGLCPPELVVGGGYLRQAGTSMAAPHVAGLAALVVAAHPSFTVEQVRQALRVGSTDAGDAGFDDRFGYGRADAAGALAQAAPLEVLITQPTSAALSGVSSVAVHGVAGGPSFESWVLDYGAGAMPATWTAFAGAGTPVPQNGGITSWNISTLRDGVYTLRLTARNTAGQAYEDRQRIVIDQVLISDPPQTAISVFRGGDVVTVRGTAAPADFAHYALVVRDRDGVVLGNAGITLTNGGVQPVVNGVLGTWNTAGVPADRYTIALEVTLADATVINESAPVIVDPTLHPGWPVNLGAFNVGGLTLGVTDHLDAADVDLDGRAELLVGYGTTVLILRHSGTSLPGWPQSVDPTGTTGHLIQKSPVVGDLDNDGLLEVVAATNGGRIFVWSRTGGLLPGWPLGHGGGPNSVAIADVNGDGTNEIVASDWAGRVDVLNLGGQSLPGWPRTPTVAATILSPPVVGDVDGDGRSEIAVIDLYHPNTLYLLGYDGATRPGWPRTLNVSGPNNPVYSYPAMGELDLDSTREIVVGADDGRVFAFNADGTDVSGWPQTTAGAPVNSPAIGDLDGDGRSEVVAGLQALIENGTRVNLLYAWRGNGTLLAGWPVRYDGPIAVGFFGFGPAALADLDGDGRTDVLASNEAPDPLRAHAPDGQPLAGFPKATIGTGAFPTNTGAVADLDGDGLLELGWIDSAGLLYVWDLPGPRTGARSWPMFHHDARHTGRGDPALVPAASDAQTLAGSILSGTFVQTQLSDNFYEVLQTARIPPLTRLNHTWRFDNVPVGSHRLVIEAFRPTNAAGDAFQFSYSTDNVSFTTIPGALVNSSNEARIEASFGSASLGRTLYIRVSNTVTSGAKNRTVNIDLLAIATVASSGP